MRDLYAQGELAERVSVVIPARNEALNLPYVLDALPAGLHEVILVDGHSVDGTVEVARQIRPDIKIVHQGRRGKGNALACGFAEVTGDIIVTLDADGSADPDEIATFVAALASGADFAKGTRFSKGGSSRDITRLRRLGNAALNGLVNRLFGTTYTDLCYGYNAFRAFLLPVLDLPPVHPPGVSADAMQRGDGFEVETLINVRMAHAGVSITEVGSTERARLHGVSNLRAFPDGLRVLRTVLAERRRPVRMDCIAITNHVPANRPATSQVPANRPATNRPATSQVPANRPATSQVPANRPATSHVPVKLPITNQVPVNADLMEEPR